MVEQKPLTSYQDIQLLYDLAIFNCLHFGPYMQVTFEDQQAVRELSNIEIAQQSTQLAAGLRGLGVEPGDRVLVMMPNSPEVVLAYQAIARASAVTIPVLPLLKAPEVRYIAENSGAKAVFTSTQLLPLIAAGLSELPDLRYIIITDLKEEQKQDNSRLVAFEEVMEKGKGKSWQFLCDLDGVAPRPDDMAVILYTSGTTGRPKGVVLTHRNLISNALSRLATSGGEEELGANRGKTHLTVLPMAHAYGLLVLNLIYAGGLKLVLHPRFDPNAILSAIERHRVDSFAGVPAMFVMLLYTDNSGYNTSSLTSCSSGSAPLPVEILRGFEAKYKCEIREGYGLSEASAALSAHTEGMVRKPGSVGRPLANLEVRIVDEQDNPMPVGEVGEIIARGPNIMHSYYNMPEETAQAMRNGWLHTGDMGRFDEDGYLYVVERKKDLIIRGGLNVYPRDVEEVLASHPAVIEAAVIGVPSERMGEEVKAFVVTQVDIDAEALMAYCREHLANYKSPSQIEFIHSLPRNPVGKIDKKELRQRYVN
jgi:long-chain acyl-CoA synthetase